MTAPGLLVVGVESGEGLVARFGDTVVLVVGEDDDRTDHLLDAVGTAASQDSAGGVASGLARWISGRPEGDTAGFGLVAPIPEGIVVFLRGDVWCEVVHGGTTTTLTGRDATTWVDRVVPEPVDRVSMGTGSARPVRPSPRSNLTAGVVPGGAFVRAPVDAGSGSAEPDGEAEPVMAAATEPAVMEPAVVEPPAVEPPAVEPSAVEPATGPEAPASPPTGRGPGVDTMSSPPPEPPPAVAPATAPSAVVPPPPPPAARGTGRSRLDDGAQPTVRLPARETSVAIVPIGVLTCADGPTLPLDRSYVVGRDPLNDASVRAGKATPITLADPTNLISRVHAFVSVDDDGVVLVRDASSVSGTYLAEPGASGWTQVSTVPTEIPPGWHVRIGTKVFVFEPTAPTTS